MWQILLVSRCMLNYTSYSFASISTGSLSKPRAHGYWDLLPYRGKPIFSEEIISMKMWLAKRFCTNYANLMAKWVHLTEVMIVAIVSNDSTILEHDCNDELKHGVRRWLISINDRRTGPNRNPRLTTFRIKRWWADMKKLIDTTHWRIMTRTRMEIGMRSWRW